jgi:hypothetical protein
MLKSLQRLRNPRWLLMVLVLIMLIFSSALTSSTKADDPLYGQIIYTFYYQDETYTGIFVQCTYNTCNGEEICDGPKTPYSQVQGWRDHVSCDGSLPPN